MRRGTTPTLCLVIHDDDMTGWDNYITLKTSSGVEITKSGSDVKATWTATTKTTLLTTALTQAETLSLTAGERAHVQLRAFKDGVAVATKVATLKVEGILKDGALTASTTTSEEEDDE